MSGSNDLLLRSLPHRQLRKNTHGDSQIKLRSLPHRQLRNEHETIGGYLKVDHCRIGSLEMLRLGAILNELDHCRIGSLENFGAEAPDGVTRSLPHRQLRNFAKDA